MYFRILKRDLKRKKVMNTIILLFISLASLFMASSVNNALTVINGVDYFMEKAGMSDVEILAAGEDAELACMEKIANLPGVSSVRTENVLFADALKLTRDGEAIEDVNDLMILPPEAAVLNFFDSEDRKITAVEPGTVYVSGKSIPNGSLKIDDIVELDFEGTVLKLRVAGICKDIITGSGRVSYTRLILNQQDYQKLTACEGDLSRHSGCMFYVWTEDTTAVLNTASEIPGVIFSGGSDVMRMVYFPEMILAAALLIASVCLILIAFTVLRFTISFTMAEEFREIGVMKAIGIRAYKIRLLYIMKYLMLAVAASATGFAVSIPAGNLLLESVSQCMVLGNDSGVRINAVCSVLVVVITALFCFRCTARVKDMSPVDAVRSGTTGERFHKRRGVRLSRVPGRPAFYLALNDILSSPKRFATVLLAGVICLLLVILLGNTVNTMQSEEMLRLFGFPETDLFITMKKEPGENIRSETEKQIAELEKLLRENGMPGRCAAELEYRLTIRHGENQFSSLSLQGLGCTTDQYTYYTGSAPRNAGEIAITPVVAEYIHADIGDTVAITFGDREEKFLVAALYQSMMNMGEGIRFHEDTDIAPELIIGTFPCEIRFDDRPDAETLSQRMETLKTLVDGGTVKTSAEFVEGMVGMAGTIGSLKQIFLLMTIGITVLVTVLMETSFVTNERSEIALLKAIGFSNGSVIAWHSLRFGIIGLLATAIALLLAKPVTGLCITPIFKMMGAKIGVNYAINYKECFLLYPALMFAATSLSASAAALFTRTIRASDTSSIE